MILMTTTTQPTPAPEKDAPTAPTPGTVPLPEGTARLIATAGAAATSASAFLAWTWTQAFPGDLTVYGYPGGLQVLTLVGSLLTLAFLLSGYGIKGLRWLTPGGTHSPALLAALGTLGVTWYAAAAITAQLGGLVNLEPGGLFAAAASLITVVGTLGLPADTPRRGTSGTGVGSRFLHSFKAPEPHAPTRALRPWQELLCISVAVATGLWVFSYGIGTSYGELFIGFLILAGTTIASISRAGLNQRLGMITAKHRNITVSSAFIAAFLFPFTQASDANAALGTYILIFATVALGLNVVVGLAGLLDLGYVAFLGVGAYAAAIVSGSPYSPFDVHFPFWAAVLTGITASLVFGVLIGAPTLRLRGDYLAIVTLGFGEIFRIAMQNLDGTSGPDITNGPNGIPDIPELVVFGYNLGEEHSLLGFEIGRFANYYLLMLLFTAIVVLVFKRSDESRIGRAWVAIREDETAAQAMGINTFRLKLMAFALGAALAGMAGTVQAHVTYTVTPTQYKFVEAVPPNSAFLLAAVILGGMGTVSGPLIGAALLYLIPEKLEFMAEYQLLLFGIALILLMRFRPEGLIADRRKKLEFHDTGQLDVPEHPGLSKTEA
ncbi:hypothetical protein N566_19095 [Streptomycetaceae bacterium MP113-05]|nr:hypothetical protein N566_19095 [Streptomycetaceae bacterium MP113-05]